MTDGQKDEPIDDRTTDAAAPSWPIDPVDPDAADLREAWSALGQVYGADASAPLDEVTTARLVRNVLRREASRRRRRVGMFALACAAAVLLLVGKPRLPSDASPAVVEQTASPSAVAAPTVVAVHAWDDPWDQEYAAVTEQVRAVELDWSRGDDSFTYFGERLRALEAEWSESSL